MSQKLIIKILFYFTLTTTLSCSKDNKGNDTMPKTEAYESIVALNGTKYIECDKTYINSFSGTICCISGPIEALPGEVLQFEYSNNLINPEIMWMVDSGKLTLKEIINATTATFMVEEGFTGGSVAAGGVSEDKRTCGEVIEITLKP